jgi:hypothetical protein
MTFHLPRVTKDTGPPADPALVVGSGRPVAQGHDPTLVILISASEGVPRESNVWKFLFLGSSSSITCFSWMSRVALLGLRE